MKAVIYILLATGMFYFTDGAFQAGGFGFMYMYLFGIAIVALGFFHFLVSPNIKRAFLLFKYSCRLSLSYVIPALLSIIIWIVAFAGFRTMTAGFFSIVYQLIGLCVAASTLYMFGEKGIWYCLAAMCLANFLIVFQVISKNGLVPFLEEFRNLIITFGGDTGTMMGNVEIHDLTFAFGPFFIYLLWQRKEVRHFLFLFVLTVFFLMVGLKRIEIVAVATALAVCLLIRCWKKEKPGGAIMAVGVLLMAVGFLYVIFIRFGLFYFLEEVLKIDTKGRNMIYQYLNTQYEISPFYFGKGLGYDRVEWVQTGMIWNRIAQDAYHNEFLRMYIEIGFWGFFTWLWLHFSWRLRYFKDKQGGNGGLLCLAYLIYLFVTYLTDNTLFYYYTNVAVFLLIMSYHMEELEKQELTQYD